ncbi:Retinoic Acid-Induced Protein 1 [Manis pentadactyla]|nr:Retinoic Acid-Induced Protein 1 [Manis pentadactyla]
MPTVPRRDAASCARLLVRLTAPESVPSLLHAADAPTSCEKVETVRSEFSRMGPGCLGPSHSSVSSATTCWNCTQHRREEDTPVLDAIEADLCKADLMGIDCEESPGSSCLGLQGDFKAIEIEQKRKERCGALGGQRERHGSKVKGPARCRKRLL